MAVHRGEIGIALKGALSGGLLGSSAMALFMVLGSVLGRDRPGWLLIKQPARFLLGADVVVQRGFDLGVVLVGAATHLFIAMVWAIPFALVALGLRRLQVFALSLVLGALSFTLMLYGVLPLLDASAVRALMPRTAWLFAHILFGLGVGLGLQAYQVDRDEEIPTDETGSALDVIGAALRGRTGSGGPS